MKYAEIYTSSTLEINMLIITQNEKVKYPQSLLVITRINSIIIVKCKLVMVKRFQA